MTYAEFEVAARKRYEKTGERYGQAFFNVLCQERPDLSERIRGGNLDPFYIGVTTDLQIYLIERW